jgi:hypothetical protein
MTDQTPTATADQTAPTAPVKAPRKAKTPRKASKPLSANEMAARLSKRHGSIVTAKSVRQWVRDNVEAYGDDRYTVHAYDARLVQRIEQAWSKRTARRTASRNGDK